MIKLCKFKNGLNDFFTKKRINCSNSSLTGSFNKSLTLNTSTQSFKYTLFDQNNSQENVSLTEIQMNDKVENKKTSLINLNYYFGILTGSLGINFTFTKRKLNLKIK